MASSVRELLADATARLSVASDSPGLDAEVLLCHVLRRDRSWLYAWPEHTVDGEQRTRFAQLVGARAAGRPVAHLTARREFWSLSLAVDEHTLIPRPETEQLVEIALTLDLRADACVLDLGTGSGAIAIALAAERPHWHITAVDRSAAALAVARRNVTRLAADHIELLRSEWFGALRDNARFDLIVANPPYVADDDPHLTRGDVRFEPREALAAGADGLDDLRRIITGAPARLAARGWLWLEHGYRQAPAVRDLLRAAGFGDVQTRADLAGHPRHSGGRLRRR